ncbi:MAG TPA: hypothetical protein VFW73_12190, partial [Lacipirellulaceae bacterium]|nr:hypothetical protein [Lacipirellulaceae bacterium]
SVVRAELLHGAEKYGNRDRRVAAVVQTFAPFRSLPFDAPAFVTTWRSEELLLAPTIYKSRQFVRSTI